MLFVSQPYCLMLLFALYQSYKRLMLMEMEHLHGASFVTQWLTSAWRATWSVTKTPIISVCVSPGHPRPTATSAEVQQLKHRTGHLQCKYLVISCFLLPPSGRAGRVSKGYCYRLVTKDFWTNEIPDYMIPEMLVCATGQKLCYTVFSIHLMITAWLAILLLSARPPFHHHAQGEASGHGRSLLSPLHSSLTSQPWWHSADCASTQRGQY